jgi:hypothetical protein
MALHLYFVQTSYTYMFELLGLNYPGETKMAVSFSTRMGSKSGYGSDLSSYISPSELHFSFHVGFVMSFSFYGGYVCYFRIRNPRMRRRESRDIERYKCLCYSKCVL